ncbi:MAG: PEP-CTERM sorting domain-containing protein [Pseudomonadota bacterium]
MLRIARLLFASIAASAALFVSAPVSAAEFIFDNRAKFESFLALGDGTLTDESFEDGFARAASLTFGDLTITEQGVPAGQRLVYNDNFIGASDGSLTANIVENGPSLIVLTFANPITAFGADFLTNADTTITFSGQGTGTFDVDSTGFQFFGFASTVPFTTIQFDASGTGFDYGIDAASYGMVTGIPEPSTWMMLFIGLFAVGGSMRRRNQEGKSKLVFS